MPTRAAFEASLALPAVERHALERDAAVTAAFFGAVEAAIAAAGIDCALVHLSQRVASRFYQGFCKATLWPTLHNVLDVYNNEKMGAIIDRENTAIDRENISTSPSSAASTSLVCRLAALAALAAFFDDMAALVCRG